MTTATGFISEDRLIDLAEGDLDANGGLSPSVSPGTLILGSAYLVAAGLFIYGTYTIARG
jgi:hypothetical protein